MPQGVDTRAALTNQQTAQFTLLTLLLTLLTLLIHLQYIFRQFTIRQTHHSLHAGVLTLVLASLTKLLNTIYNLHYVYFILFIYNSLQFTKRQTLQGMSVDTHASLTKHHTAQFKLHFIHFTFDNLKHSLHNMHTSH